MANRSQDENTEQLILKNIKSILIDFNQRLESRDFSVHLDFVFYKLDQGPRRNFEIGGRGGGAPLVTQYWGGQKTLFLTNSL